MNAIKTNNATNNATNATNNWGFKTSVQFKVAYRLAQGYGHLWAQGKNEKVVTRTPTTSGAIRIEEEWVHMDPSTPQEAHEWASKDPFGGRSEPTPQWESGSKTYKIKVHPSGGWSCILNGILEKSVDAKGKTISWGLVPGWMDKWTGRANTLGEAVILCADHYRYDHHTTIETVVDLFESQRDFWKTGLQAGTRWYN